MLEYVNIRLGEKTARSSCIDWWVVLKKAIGKKTRNEKKKFFEKELYIVLAPT
jgi:hypothetical protein